MKKMMISAVALLFAAGTAMAQDGMTTSSDGGIKAAGGDVTLEANVNLWGGGGSSTVGLSNGPLNQIKVRYFMSDDIALRLGANITLESNTLRDPVGNGDDETKQSHFGVSIMPGIEKHFAGTNRLSPYIGAELGIAIDSRKQETTFAAGGSNEATGAWYGPGGGIQRRGNTRIGLNAIGGFDFYVAQHLFVGYELGFGLGIQTEAEVEVKSGSTSNVVEGKNSSFFISPIVRNGIRVGFVF